MSFIKEFRRIKPVFCGVLRYANHSEELNLHDPQEVQRPRQLAAHQKVRAEQKPGCREAFVEEAKVADAFDRGYLEHRLPVFGCRASG
jgi:hypothetical protein